MEGIIEYSEKLFGGFDMAIVGTTAYFLTVLNTLAVVDLGSGKMLQEFTYRTPDDRPFWTGMATYPADPAYS